MKGTMTIRIDDETKNHIVKEANKLYSTPSRLAYEILKQRYETNSSSKTTNLTQKGSNSIGNAKKRTK
jgi:predicted transcriptional regulator